MNWKSHDLIHYRGRTFGQKDIEFEKLKQAGWRVRDAHEVTATSESFKTYLCTSQGEFSVAKNVFVATSSGWFSDRSAAYLASSRPVVLQDTGFSAHLPCGRGLFAVRTAEEAAAAIETVASNFDAHARAAREIAAEYLDAPVLLRRFLSEIDIV